MRLKSLAKNTISSAAVATAMTFSSPGSGAAQQTWDYTGFFYLWGASLGGTTTSGQSVEMSFRDILDTLDFGLMGSLEATRGPLALFGDAIYLNISESKNATVGPGIPAVADVDVKGFVFTGGVGYDLLNNGQTRVNGFGGLRHMQLDNTANISVGGGSNRITGKLRNWDAIVGIRGSQTLSDKWALAYYADIGTGESDLTWQAALTFDYRINNWDLSFGYRHLTWDISNSSVLSDLTFSGPFLGAKFRF